MNRTGLIISVAGIRGIYGRDLTEDVAFRFGMAFGMFAGEKNVFVGSDTRQSSKPLMLAFTAGLKKVGIRVENLGISPTPAVTYMVEKSRGKSLGAIITASHNPSEYNGIKLVGTDGTFLGESDYNQVLSAYQDNRFLESTTQGIENDASQKNIEYLDALVHLVDFTAIKAKAFSVVVDPVGGVGAVFSPQLLERFGCKVFMVNDGPPGTFLRNPEPSPHHLSALMQAVVQFKADIGFAQDPDGDRLVLVDENGAAVSEEYGLALLIQYLLSQRKGPIVVNCSTTMLMEDICREANVALYRTKIGEAHVVRKMREVGAVAGGEGNGGIIFPEFHYGRDSFAAMALALEMLAKQGTTLSLAVKKFPSYLFLKEKVQMDREALAQLYSLIKKQFSDGTVDETDGLKIIFPGLWFQLRPSGTEPVVRIFVEGKNPGMVKEMRKRLLTLVSRVRKISG
jgi:phosphoglucosamine mutase